MHFSIGIRRDSWKDLKSAKTTVRVLHVDKKFNLKPAFGSVRTCCRTRSLRRSKVLFASCLLTHRPNSRARFEHFFGQVGVLRECRKELQCLLMALSGNVVFCHPQSLKNQKRTGDQPKSGDHPFLMLWTISRPEPVQIFSGEYCVSSCLTTDGTNHQKMAFSLIHK